jgi:hypothetical protein
VNEVCTQRLVFDAGFLGHLVDEPLINVCDLRTQHMSIAMGRKVYSRSSCRRGRSDKWNPRYAEMLLGPPAIHQTLSDKSGRPGLIEPLGGHLVRMLHA